MTLLHSSATRTQPECTLGSASAPRNCVELYNSDYRDPRCLQTCSIIVPAPTTLPWRQKRNGPITVYMSCPGRVGTLHHRGHNIYSPLLSKLPKLFLMDRKSNTVNCPPRRGVWEGAWHLVPGWWMWTLITVMTRPLSAAGIINMEHASSPYSPHSGNLPPTWAQTGQLSWI